MMVIHPSMFCALLDNLTGQFFREQSARCTTAEDFGGQLSKDAQEFFSIVIHCGEDAELGNDDIMGILCDDTKDAGGKDTFTFVIFVNCRKFQGLSQEIALAVLFSHEVCHFVFYYELFLLLGGVKSNKVYNKFKNTIYGTFEGGITPALDTISQTAVDKHSVAEPIDRRAVVELIELLGNYPDEHFTNNNKTQIDYKLFFFHLLEHLKIR